MGTMAAERAEADQERGDGEVELRKVVQGVVGGVVGEVGLRREKERVQALINGLVKRVGERATEEEGGAYVDDAVTVGDNSWRVLENGVEWMQSVGLVSIVVGVAAGVRAGAVNVTFARDAVKSVVNGAVVVEGSLCAPIDVDGCLWALEGEGEDRRLILEMEKRSLGWWRSLWSGGRAGKKKIERVDASAPNQKQDTRGVPLPPPLPAGGGHDGSENDTVPPPPDSPPPQSEHKFDDDDIALPAHSGVDDVVKDVVDDIVESVASSCDDSHDSTAEELFGHEQQKEPERQPKVLSRADLGKIIEQYMTDVQSGGPTSAESALQLATFYHHGIGLPHNDVMAARMYKYALENGVENQSAAFQLGLIFNQGADGLEPNPEQAVRWWRMAAKLGNSVAMFNLGVMSMNGSGCDMDPLLATRWFQQAQALNPQLNPPHFSRVQLEERMAVAARMRKEKARRAMPTEERQRRRDQALANVRTVAYGAAALVSIAVAVTALHQWWKNRL